MEDLASQLDAGLRAFSRSDYPRALSLLLPCAEAGEVKAQLLLSRMYYAGNGVERDLVQYRYWLQQAADAGDKSARARLKRLQAEADLQPGECGPPGMGGGV